MSGPVTFNYATWVQRYPEFTAVSSALAQSFFTEAGLYCANPNQVIPDDATLTILLNMLTAHIASINPQSWSSTTKTAPPPGRISSAEEGSVNVGYAFDYPPGTPQWYNTTPYGAQYWAATAVYRTGNYRVYQPNGNLTKVPWFWAPGTTSDQQGGGSG